MGITMKDITKGDWNFVYGLADLMDGTGVFSLARFSPEFNNEQITLRSGTCVQLEGVEDRPELNGQTGIIRSFDPSLDRYAVKLRDGRTIGLQLSNLTSVDAGAASLLSEERRLLVLERASKVLCHELGHIFGLKHCTEHACLMNGVNHFGELIAQPLLECPCCLRKLGASFKKWCIAERYQALAALYGRLHIGTIEVARLNSAILPTAVSLDCAT
jgi:hypothetical protein